MKKIKGILVCMLLIAAAVLPVAGSIDNKNSICLTTDEFSECLNPTISGNWIEEAKLLAQNGGPYETFGFDVSLDGDTALIGAWGDDDNGYQSGSAYVFKRTGSTWTQEAKLLANDGEANDHFGERVFLDGDTALIGATHDDDKGFNSGSVYVFERSGSTWTQGVKLLASDGTVEDWFGISIFLDGDTALIGAAGDDDNGKNSGSVYVFERSGSTWTQKTKLLANDGEAGDYFCVSVSLDGDTALIGAWWDDDNGYNSGSAYIFERIGSTWTQKAKLLANDGDNLDGFGNSVSLDGDIAFIGAAGDEVNGEYSGSVYVFERIGSIWNQDVKILPSDGQAGDSFGRSISLDGDTVLISAPGDDDVAPNSGSVYVYENKGTWIKNVKILASDGEGSDDFGFEVCLDGNTALIGARHDDDNGENSGSAYVFKKESDCCLVIDSISGGLFDSSRSLTVNAVIRNTGTGACEDVTWSFAFSGDIVIAGQNNGLEPTLPAGGTMTIYSNTVIGFSVPGLLPAFVTVTADAANNDCPPAIMEKQVLLFFILLSVY